MLWLIWIALMVLTPVVVGITVWRQTHAQPVEVPVSEPNRDA